MRRNTVRQMWNEDRTVYAGWLAIPSAVSAEMMAHQGWDSLVVDLQHGLVDYTTAIGMLTAISTTSTIPLVRIPWLDPGIIMKMLDAGAYGVICPMVNTRDEAEAFVGACSYPPRGYRSFGPTRAVLYAGDDYPEHANDTVIKLAMVETAAALENLDDILSVEGLDGIFIGPSDLSVALGHPPRLDIREGPVAETIGEILAKARQRGRIAGVYCGTPEYARYVSDVLGARFLPIGSDGRCLADESQRILSVVSGKEQIEQRREA